MEWNFSTGDSQDNLVGDYISNVALIVQAERIIEAIDLCKEEEEKLKDNVSSSNEFLSMLFISKKMHPTYLFEIDFYLNIIIIFVSNINVKV